MVLKIFKSCKKLIYGKIEKHFLQGCSNYNSVEVRRHCRSKKQARDVFLENKVPCAKGEVFYNPFKVLKFIQKNGFPVVIKPNIGGFSRGAYFPITNYKDLLKAAFKVKIWWPSSIIESYLLGKNYRVVMTKFGIMSVIQREPAFIIGNNKNTISELIDLENQIREDMHLAPIINKIDKNSSDTKKNLQNYNLNSILKSGEKIYLHNKVALKPGGILSIVNSHDISNKNKELFKKILEIFSANILGIDVIMSKGLAVDFDKQDTIVLEVNSRPFLAMHQFPRYGEKEDLQNFIIQLEGIKLENKNIF